MGGTATSGIGGVQIGGAGGSTTTAGTDSMGGATNAAGADISGAGTSPDESAGSNDGGTAGERSSTEGGAFSDGGAPDTTPPEIVSVVPADAARGVSADADIVITFSESMSEDETQYAFTSDDLRPSQISFSWSDAGRTMTVHPKDGLEYGAEDALRSYSFSITTLARDVAGNHLAETGAFSFTTLARITRTVMPVDVRQLTEDGDTTKGCDITGAVTFGDTAANKGLGALVTFNLDAIGTLPSPENWTTATLSAQLSLGGVSAVSAYHVTADPSLVTWDSPLSTDLGSLVVQGNGLLGMTAVDVLSAVVEDAQRANSERLSQYEFRSIPLNDDKAEQGTLVCQNLRLDLVYFVP